MQNRIDALAYELTGKFTLEECSVDEIKHLTRRHPYFAPAQFLLLHKLRQTASDEAAQQEQKAVLYYHDPLQFSVFISGNGISNGNGLVEAIPSVTSQPIHVVTPEPVYGSSDHIIPDFEEVAMYETQSTSTSANDWELPTEEIVTAQQDSAIGSEAEFIAEVEDQNDQTAYENFNEVVNDTSEVDNENLATVDTDLKDEIDSLPQLIEAYRNESYKPYEATNESILDIESTQDEGLANKEDVSEVVAAQDVLVNNDEENQSGDAAVHQEIDSLPQLIEAYRNKSQLSNDYPTNEVATGDINNADEETAEDQKLFVQRDEIPVGDVALQQEIDSLPQIIEAYRKEAQLPEEEGKTVEKIEEEIDSPFDDETPSEQNFHETEVEVEQQPLEAEAPATVLDTKEEIEALPQQIKTYHNDSSTYGESFFQTEFSSPGITNSETVLPPKEPEQNQPVFEAFHTVDYFASQGIKILHDDQPRDRLAKQMKSFTEWLKTMKRLPSAQLVPSTQSAAEKNVESMATSSVAASDVVTEAMAEVWAKQGAIEKAIQIYKKLSLLDPSKKPYFAAKIDNLKNH